MSVYYSKAVIYGIYCKDITVLEIYIGSTHDKIERERDHKKDCNNENRETHYNLKVYIFIRDNGGWDNWKFEVIEEFPCENDIELRIQEQYYYDLLNPLLNSQRPYVSEEERKEYNKNYDAKYKKDNKEYYKEIYAKYYIDNREEILKKQNHKFTCECGKEYTFGHKKRHCDSNIHKEFIENNKLNTI